MGEAGDDRLDRKRIDVGCAFVKEKKIIIFEHIMNNKFNFFSLMF